MRRGLGMALGAAMLALALAGCSGDDVTIESGGGNAETAGVTVAGHGEAHVQPDTGYFDVGVQVTAATVEAARERAAQLATTVIASVKQNGVDAKDVQTSNLSIQPRYDYSKTGSPPTITGYVVTNTITVTVRKLDGFSKLIDDAVKAGGNDARLQSVRFGVEDTAKAAEQARQAAMADAKSKAEQLAKLGGVTLGKPRSITETQGATPVYPASRSAGAPAADSGTSTPIETGTSKVTVDVTVRWAID
ncbi:MAG: SIMPL domain-containing protein [Dehalococcoidia bacterium]